MEKFPAVVLIFGTIIPLFIVVVVLSRCSTYVFNPYAAPNHEIIGYPTSSTIKTEMPA
jgi:hypothetical protein